MPDRAALVDGPALARVQASAHRVRVALAVRAPVVLHRVALRRPARLRVLSVPLPGVVADGRNTPRRRKAR